MTILLTLFPMLYLTSLRFIYVSITVIPHFSKIVFLIQNLPLGPLCLAPCSVPLSMDLLWPPVLLFPCWEPWESHLISPWALTVHFICKLAPRLGLNVSQLSHAGKHPCRTPSVHGVWFHSSPKCRGRNHGKACTSVLSTHTFLL